MYDASRPSRPEEGDPELKAQLIKITRARSVFRYPLPDADGFRSMRMEGNIGWRDWKFPGPVMYGQPANAWCCVSSEHAQVRIEGDSESN